ncbi:hypothetical protein [Pantoea agglomerans]|uniref:hypothetical protein n=1 Tax=Enterobacter agglomerans TaxID=549 RepID=UPI003C7D5BFF
MTLEYGNKKTAAFETKLNEIYAWGLNLTITLSGIQLWLSTKSWMNDSILIVMNILLYLAVPVLMWLDNRELKKARCIQPSWWWILLYPGWLFRRTKYNPNKKLRNAAISACVYYVIMLVVSSNHTAKYDQDTEDYYPSSSPNMLTDTEGANRSQGNQTLTREQVEQALSGLYRSATPDMADNRPSTQVEEVLKTPSPSADSLRRALHSRCDKPVFYAQTADHKKEVQICIATPSVSYSFGSIGTDSKELDISVPMNDASYTYQTNRVISIYEFTVKTGDFSYQVSAGANDEGQPLASLSVYRGEPEVGHRIADIALDPATVVNEISYDLQNDGVVKQDGF